MTTNTQRGRAALIAWEHSKPHNFFSADSNIQHVLHRYASDNYAALEPALHAFGLQCATIIDRLAKQEDQIGNHPRLARYNGIGERIEQIEFHPNHDEIGRIVWQSGMMALQSQPGHVMHQSALMYLLSHNGEAGRMCSAACTAGLIRALQQAADPTVRDLFLPGMLRTDFYEETLEGAQFLTEVQGGSDVGVNAVTAIDQGDGTWRLNGEKWFCSNINATLFLVMARVVDANGEGKSGTTGLGAFVMHRVRPDGQTNGFYIRRLKDKLGTRTLASAELDFVDALAYPIGAVEHGFKTTVELVLNTSRLINAVACAGIMRRAYIEAHSYACSREAFGNPIATYPLVQEAIADILSEAHAATASSFFLAHLLDQIETERVGDDDKGLYRLLVNVNKYITSIRATESIHRAIEVLGGNGAIESFSILPRLYRDMIVLESWEGTHNVLALQVLRDLARYSLHESFARWFDSTMNSVNDAHLTDLVTCVRVAYQRFSQLLDQLLAADSTFQQAHARRLIDLLGAIAQGALLLHETQYELTSGIHTSKFDVTTYFIQKRLIPAYDPISDNEYIARLARLMN